MEQLLSMGFTHDLASQALAATGGHSTLEATEWILTHHHPSSTLCSTPSSTLCSTPSSNLSSPPSQSQSQPTTLDRFFLSKPHPSSTLCSTPSSNLCSTHSQSSTLDRFFLSKPDPSSSSSSSAAAASITTTTTTTTKSEPTKRPKLCSTPTSSPLSDRMRPRTLDDVVGQDHLLGPTSILRSAIHHHLLPSLLLWGPPGSGKTSIARAIASSLPSPHRFLSLSAVTATVKDIRDAVNASRLLRSTTTVLFIDEVHRFTKAQQDSFLPAIEDGSIVFLGATTENPSFHLTTPLLSRLRVLALRPLDPHHISSLLRRAVLDAEKGLPVSARVPISVDDDAIEFLSLNSDGDARVALNGLEIAATLAVDKQPGSSNSVSVNLADAKEALQCKHLAYDRAGEEHYNLISALHKSMRGSDADAAIYWLVRMLEGGEQPLYIARRLVRFASEDVGLADPAALGHAVACYQACHFLGMPECDVNLSQCVAYLALAPKSVAVYKAMNAAKRVVRESGGGNEGVPLHLRNAPTKLMKEFGYGKGYIYPPDHLDDSSSQTYLPPSLQGCKFLDWPPHDEKPQ